jgi:adenosylcobinamide kinase/adenosylcobinamide-phosphate guanylyltransferase
MCHADPSLLNAEVEALLALLPRLPGRLIIVANEVGLGVIPINALARRFGDVAGTLHQQLAGLCDAAVLMVAGLPLALKGADR